MEELMAEEVSLRYGLDETGYTVETNTIKPNQFLAEILLPLGVSYPEIARLEEVANHVFPLNKLRANDTYVTFCTSDTSQTLHYFVVETGKADYVVYQFRDSIYAYKGQKPIETRLRKASGVINSSLNATILDQDLPASLAHDLSSMYAWTVDFYRIQKGDYFRVIFEEQFVDGKSIGVGNILAAEFNHRERSFQGFYFVGGDQASYFDEKAESLRKAFLKAPLEYSRISSRYTMKRYHPVQKRWKAHLGTDYAAPTGTPIMATGDGTVIESSYGKYNGNYVKIRHNGMYTTQYLHMSKRLVKKGQVVKQGEIIGKVGATGLASGPHVCYRFWKDGKQVDPYKQNLPPSDPVDKTYLGDFYTHRDTLAELLQAIPVQNQTEELP
jgi:murein DD-endopeptidase MepM/ murein hydrolase activator NlpD